MRYVKCLVILLLSMSPYLQTHAQNKQDYMWLLGQDKSIDPGIQAFRMDFNAEALQIPKTDNGLEFDSMNASICDEEGKLLFYSNGCAVSNSKDELMENGDSINAGPFFDILWQGDCKNGYPGAQDIMILPDPSNDLGYYLIHKRTEFDGEKAYIENILNSYIDLSENDGLGKVLYKNDTLLHYEEFLSYYLTAINHVNGKDWWIIQPVKDDNKYVTILLDEFGFHIQDNQTIGTTFFWDASAGGTAKFSPDGTKYATFNYGDGLKLFDFDRSTGKLSNFRELAVLLDPVQNFGSVEWSPNSRFIYAASGKYLHQIDTWEEDLADGLIEIAEWSGFSDPFPNRYFLMSLAPDCRIYMCSTSANNSYHVIHYPDQKGSECGFVEGGLKLPRSASFGGFPNFPRWRVDAEEKCDSSILTMFGKPVYYSHDLTVFPNPTTDGQVQLELPSKHESGTLYVWNLHGTLLRKESLDQYTERYTWDLGGLVNGQYYIEFVPDENLERESYIGKFLKM